MAYILPLEQFAINSGNWFAFGCREEVEDCLMKDFDG
jgi:hypothetical protein